MKKTVFLTVLASMFLASINSYGQDWKVRTGSNGK